jgi:hypothetical protein
MTAVSAAFKLFRFGSGLKGAALVAGGEEEEASWRLVFTVQERSRWHSGRATKKPTAAAL